MKKIIFTMFLVSSTLLLAKTEEPKLKLDFPKKEEVVLVAKKSIKEEQISKKIELKKEDVDPHTACVVGFAFFVWSHGGNFLAAAAIGDSLCP